MKELFNFWPKEIAYPERQLVENFDDMLHLINRYNNVKCKLYFSLYNCNETHKFDNCYLDKIAFDLDGKDRLNCIRKLHKKLKEKDIRHMMIFSTKGFWCYVFTRNYEHINNKKDCLTNSQRFIAKECNLTIGFGEDNDIDQHIVGDISRVTRLPLSYDKDRQLYCICVSEEDLDRGYEYIKEKAKVRHFEFYYYGSKYFNIKRFDSEIKEVQSVELKDFNITNDDELIKDFLPCIKRILIEDGKDTYNNRYNFALYCREIGLPKNICDIIAKKYFSKTKRADSIGTNYDHFKKFRVANYAYRRNQDFFPRCERLKDVCVKGCKGRGVYR